MRTPEQIILSQRRCGWFFVLLGLLSLALAPISFWQGHWIKGSILSLGVVFFILVGRLAIIGTLRKRGFGGGPYRFDIGKPTPVKPSPIHHLQAAKDLPPSEKTRIFPKD